MKAAPSVPRLVAPDWWPRLWPWLLTLLGAGLVIWFGRELGLRVQQREAFGLLRLPNGGWVALAGLIGTLGVLALTSAAALARARSRKNHRSTFWSIYTVQLTHLILCAVVLGALYPLIYIVLASFDSRNSLYSVGAAPGGNLLTRARIIPDTSGYNLDNYRRLIDGVVIPAWQWALLAASGLGLLGMGLSRINMVAWRKSVRPSESVRRERLTSWSQRLFLGALALWLLLLSGSQFTGSGTETKFLLHVRNTLVVSGMTGLLGILLSTTAGYAMARLRFPGRFGTLLFFIFVQMFPGFLGLVATYYLLYSLGLLGTFSGLVLAYSGGAIAFNTWIYKGYVESLPASLEEAALVDGATRWGAFWRIVLPLSGPVLVFVFVNQFIGTYAEFLISNIVLTGVDHWTVGMSLRNFVGGAFSTKWGVFAAASTVGALPIVLLFYLFQRFFTGGMTAGGVKE
jgi:arabinogalactan oligomer / maltooligosaccharide transport system permease protein